MTSSSSTILLARTAIGIPLAQSRPEESEVDPASGGWTADPPLYKTFDWISQHQRIAQLLRCRVCNVRKPDEEVTTCETAKRGAN